MKYTGIERARDGKEIPVAGGAALHSKYAPEREAENFASRFSSGGFFVVAGAAGGYHISSLLQKFPDSRVLAVEKSQNEIEFISRIPEIAKLREDERVRFSTTERIEDDLVSFYKPAIHGKLTVAALRSWEGVFGGEMEKIEEKVRSGLQKISADFSVQRHFGKIWQKNIFDNLRLSAKLKPATPDFPTERVAAVVAAGPSFDETFRKIAENRGKYFVIATDTALGALLKRGIEADAAVSVDGQMVSHTHFMGKIGKSTAFFFDLCANPSAARRAADSGAGVFFCASGHPLAQYAANYTGVQSFPTVETGSGTVTIAAADIALKAGFSEIELFGADFAYSRGKAYTKGTYLEENLCLGETRLDNAETRYAAIMFRSPLKQLGNGVFTSGVLDSYSNALEDFMRRHGLELVERGKTSIFAKKDGGNSFRKMKFGGFDYQNFTKFYSERLGSILESGKIGEDSAEALTLLPLAAAIGGENSLILALTRTLGYTRGI